MKKVKKIGKHQRHLLIVTGTISLVLVLLTNTACSTSAPSQVKQATPTPEIVYTTIMPPTQPLNCPNQQGQTNTFVTAKGTQLFYQNAPLKLYGYTFYPAAIGGAAAWQKSSFTRYIDHILDMGKAAGQNLLRPTDFWDSKHSSSRQENVTVWQNIDYLVCAAKQRGMFVVMDISAFAHWLTSQQHNPYDARNWTALINAVARRYLYQPSIAFYSLLGEPTPPKTRDEMNRLVDFYRTVTDQLASTDEGHHLITAGGFNHMEDESANLPWWHTIYQLPHNDIAAFKTYSQHDIQLIPTITAFTKSVNKPALDEEFGLPQNMGDGTYTGESYNNIQMGRAQFYQEVYRLGEQQGVIGFVFWNMGCGLKDTDYEVNPNTPAVWNVIQAHAPDKPDLALFATELCPAES